MRNIVIIVKIYTWILRIVLFSYITYILLKWGMDIIYSLVCSFTFMIFWTWLMWNDDVIKPIR